MARSVRHLVALSGALLLLAAAAAVRPAAPDVAIVFANDTETEGADRSGLALPGGRTS